MKQLLILARTANGPEGHVPTEILTKIQAARSRHSACGVSSLFVRKGDRLLIALEGAPKYVDRACTALAQDGLIEDLHLLTERSIDHREFSEVALCLVEANTLSPPPSWAAKDLTGLDLRTVRRILKGLRAFHGLHTEPVRNSPLRSVQVGPIRIG